MTVETSQRHVCPDLDRAIADGFVREAGGFLRLADLQSRGPSGSAFESRLYGPEIAFCPFCGSFLTIPKDEAR
jgi:hypothetical protein